MVKIKYGQAVAIFDTLSAWYNQPTKMKLSKEIADATAVLAPQVKTYQELKERLVEKYAEKEEDGKRKVNWIDKEQGLGTYVFGENEAAFVTELNELNTIEVDCPVLSKVLVDQCDLDASPREYDTMKQIFA